MANNIQIEGLEYLRDRNYQRMVKLLGISKNDSTERGIAEKVSFISDWVGNKMNSEDEYARLAGVHTLIKKLGVGNRQGNYLLDHLYRFTRLNQEHTNIVDQQSLMEPFSIDMKSEKESDIKSLKNQLEALESKIDNR